MPEQLTLFGAHLSLSVMSQAGDRLVELERYVDLSVLEKIAEGIWRTKA